MSKNWERYPTDEMSLRLLIKACEINEDTGQSHLEDFLMMGTRVKSSTLIDGEEPEEGEEASLSTAPVYLTEFEEGFEPHSPQSVIISLAEEILRLQLYAWYAEQQGFGEPLSDTQREP